MTIIVFMILYHPENERESREKSKKSLDFFHVEGKTLSG
jgi:hypothetical protein